jgi:hypothetical protein
MFTFAILFLLLMGLIFIVLVLAVFLGWYLKVLFIPISCDLEVIESD